jgi:hypothetical protein
MTEEQKIEKESKLKPIDILDSMKSDLPVFVGFSPRGPVDEATEIKRWGQFIVKFGSFKKCGYLATSANGFFLNGGKSFLTLNLGERPESIEEVKNRFEEGLKVLDGYDDIPFIIAPGEDDPSIHEVVLDYCTRKGTYALLDGPEELIESIKEPEESVEGSEETEEGGETAPEEDSEKVGEEGRDESEEEKYENMPGIKGDQGLVIYPWIYLKDRVMGNFYIPPTGHVAAILCRLYNEKQRPEFSEVKGTILLKYKFSPEDIEKYSPRGISFLKYPTKNPGLMLI